MLLVGYVCLVTGCVGQVASEPGPYDPEIPDGDVADLRGAEYADGWQPEAFAPGEEVPPTEEPPPREDPPVEEPAPEEPSGPASRDLGPLPAEMAGLRWPTAPTTTREVTVTDAASLAREASVPGTRILANGVSGGGLSLSANDVEIIFDGSSRLGTLSFGHGTQRVRVVGGQWSGVRFPIPASWDGGGPSYRSDWMAEDISLEGLRVVSGDSAIELRGRRIAILESDITAERYSVWCGDTGPMQSEDLILFRNSFDSAGPESTVRLVSVLRTATIENRIANSNKHNYRIHGTSDLAYARDNLLINTGVMLGRMAGDTLNRIWFDDNVFHHVAPDLFNPDGAIGSLRARRNLAMTDVWSCFYCGAAPAGWDIADNVVAPYTPAP